MTSREFKKTLAYRHAEFETGRVAPMLYRCLFELGAPVIHRAIRQAYQGLKEFATHKTACNDVRGLAHLARTGFFKPVPVNLASSL